MADSEIIQPTTMKGLKATGKVQWERDKATAPGGVKGFCVKVSATGLITFYLSYTSPTTEKRKYHNLGNYPKVKLADARKQAGKVRDRIKEGIDPAGEREKLIEEQKKARKDREDKLEAERKKQEAEDKAATVNELLDYYISNQSNQGTIDNITILFNNGVRPAIGQMKAKAVTSKDIKAVIQPIKERGSNISARQTYIYLHAAFNRAIKDDECPGHEEWDINPVSKVTKPAKGEPDKTALSKDDIRTLWTTLESYVGMEDALKDALRVLLLTGQRVQEVIGMEWSELDLEDGVWSIPPNRLKTGKKRAVNHIVPLTPMVADIIKRQPVLVDDKGNISNQVFPGRHDIHTPYKWRSLGKAVGRMIERESLPHFSPRTLRGTVKTHMARIKVLKEVRNRIQNHALTDVADVHYDAHDYFDEKQSGLMKWERELQRIVGEQTEDNVVMLRA
ncbi:MAG: tyrosine-type recombinase/integrase [Candidatus Marinimicrobia bacterium]|nr:tyrosine-type recombinase/integrase [Candidatus Neomarinimicrobiota bacterium]